MALHCTIALSRFFLRLELYSVEYVWLPCTGTANSLTGEGHAHEKVVIALEPAARAGGVVEDALPVSHGHGAIPLAECKNMVFMGTLACGGHAKAVVTATGKV